MPDISKCEGIDCPIKENCYRFTSEPCEYQAYSAFWRDCLFYDKNNKPYCTMFMNKDKR